MKEQKIIKLPYFGIPKLFPFVQKYRKEIRLIFITTIISSIIESLYPLFSRYAIDHFIALNTLDTLPYFIGLFCCFVLFHVLIDFVELYCCGLLEVHINQLLRNTAFNHLQTLSFSYFNQNSVGYIHSRIMSDTNKIGVLFSWNMMDIIFNIFYIISMISIMFAINIKLTIYVLMFLPLALLVITFFKKNLRSLNRTIREINSRIIGRFSEGIIGIKAIKTLVIEDKMQADFEKETNEMLQTSIRTTRYSGLLSASISMISSIALAMILWKGGYITLQGVMQIGTLSIFANYALSLLDPIYAIANIASNLIFIQTNIERFITLLQTKSDVSDTAEVIQKYGDTFHPKKENWEELYGDIQFEDVSFKYPDGDEMVLEHFNLQILQGQNIAIVGETGAGKSTLVNLICRFFEPTSGRILIDGKDIQERSQSWLHSYIGYVLQSPHLFSGTIRENLKYGKPDATDSEIINALKTVSAEYLLKKLENGLDSEVGESGDLLSTGEKQLLSFARALLANPKILILDEATSSIDTLTEKAIQNAISVITQGRTSFVIAHRLSTIVNADTILVVKDGKILERGKHDELLKAKGYYYSLYTKQFEELFTT